jgi:methylenetetrahydrofolate--tRNA-(uracil-5-)-methyltransferase
VTGVEGYVESCAGGLLCAIMLAQTMRGHDVVPPPVTTALGGIRTHLSRETERFQPSNITWACIPPPDDARLRKRDRYQAMAERALADLDRWLASAPLAKVSAAASSAAATAASAPSAS